MEKTLSYRQIHKIEQLASKSIEDNNIGQLFVCLRALERLDADTAIWLHKAEDMSVEDARLQSAAVIRALPDLGRKG